MKKILCILLIIVILSVALVACTPKDNNDGHTHTFADSWSKDETSHWHKATCEHTDEKKDLEDHIDENGDFFCDVCEYPIEHTHTYEDTWTQTEKTHYYKATCGHNVKKAEANHLDADNNGVCDVCEYDYNHEHTYATEWTHDTENHWHAASCGHVIDPTDKAAHADADNNGICDVCEYDYDHDHTYSVEWTADENGHFHAVTCGHNVPAKDITAHTDTDKNGLCDVCNYVICAHTYAEDYSSNADNHWKDVTCGCNVSAGFYGTHVDANGDKACDTCGYIAQHFHTIDKSVWISDATAHWYAASCHSEIKDSYADHTDTDVNGKCDVCEYVIFNVYSITIDKFDYVTVESLTSAKEGTEITITITVPNNAELVEVIGAEYVSGPTEGRNAYVYTYKIASINADTTVKIVTNKLIASEEMALGASTLTQSPESSFYWIDSIVFNAPAAGKYIIYSTNEEISFGPADGSSYERTYIFETTEACETIINSTLFLLSTPDGDSISYDYEIHKIDTDITLKADTGSGYIMPNNVFINVSYKVSESGLYQITSGTKMLLWNDEILTAYVFKAEAGETITFTLKNDNFAVPTFEFDWNIDTIPVADIVEGSNTINIPFEGYLELTFTPEVSGSYSFSFSGNNGYSTIFYWNEEYNKMYPEGPSCIFENLVAGESISFYVFARDYEYTLTADVIDTLNVTNMGYKATEADGGYNSMASADGFANYITIGTEGDYALIIPANTAISLDGGENWLTGSDNVLFFEEGAVINYLVKTTDGAEMAIIGFIRISYEFTLSVGENTVTLLPGKEYGVYLTGFENPSPYKDFVLTWEDQNVYVEYSGVEVISGSTVSNYSEYYQLTIKYSGESATEVSFTLTNPVGAPSDGGDDDQDDNEGGDVEEDKKFTLMLGSNSLNITKPSGHECVFTATENGTYTLSAAGDETNDYVMIGDSSSRVSLPYEFELSEGESITFVIGTNDGEKDTINLKLEVIPNYDEVGYIDVTTTDTYCYIDEYTFVAPHSGTYTFKAPAGLGIYSKTAYNSFASAEIDFYSNSNGASFKIKLKEGQSFTFFVGALTKDSWTITYGVQISEDTGDNEGGETGGSEDTGIIGTYSGSLTSKSLTIEITEETVTFTQGDYSVTMTYSVEDYIVTLYKDDGSVWNTMFYDIEITDGVPTAAVYNGNYYSIHKTA